MTWKLALAGVTALGLIASSASAAEFGEYGMSGLRIGVKDLAKSMDFYQKVGMKVGRKYHEDQQEMTWEKPSQGPNVVLVTGSKMIPGSASLMWYVPDVTATVKALKAAGYTDATEPKGNDQYVISLAHDPDGNMVEMIGPGSKGAAKPSVEKPQAPKK